MAESSRLLGTSLRGKWRIDALLGAGGMGTVYAATHRNGSRGAIKILHAQHAADAETRARFVREGLVANRVKHDGVVRIVDDDVTDDGVAFIVMELLDGETWKSRWVRAGRKLPAREVLTTALSVLEILEAAHAAEVLHRDIKPDNVFVTRDGKVKLLDFGIARLREMHVDQTETGALLGTPAFMSPEQALGHWNEVDTTSDLFSLGATLWVLISGQPVHACQTATEALVLAATKQARPFATVFPEATPELSLVIDRALKFERSARWLSARDMRDAVVRAIASLAAESTAVATAIDVTERLGAKALVKSPESSTRPEPKAVTIPSGDARSAPQVAAVSEPPTDRTALPTERTVLSASASTAVADASTANRPSPLWPMLTGASLAVAASLAGFLWFRDKLIPATVERDNLNAVRTSEPVASTNQVTTPAPVPTEIASSVVASGAALATASHAQASPPGRVQTQCMCRGPRERAMCAKVQRVSCECQGKFMVYPTDGTEARSDRFLFPSSTDPVNLEGKPCAGFYSNGGPHDGAFENCFANCDDPRTFAGVTGGICRAFDGDGKAKLGKLDCPR